jgi:hypothetical protein
VLRRFAILNALSPSRVILVLTQLAGAGRQCIDNSPTYGASKMAQGSADEAG